MLTLLLITLLMFPQAVPPPTTHYTTLTWTASADVPSPPPAGSGYDIWRAPGVCPASGIPAGAAKIAPLVATTTYYDTAVTVGSTYCYYVVAVVSSQNSLPSNDAGDTILPFAAAGVTATAH